MKPPINPYEASQTPDRLSLRPADLRGASEDRDYSARLTWADRRDLLRSVGPTRVIAMAALVLLVKQMYSLVTLWGLALVTDPDLFATGYQVLAAGLAVAWLVQGVLSIYGVWLEWQYARQVADAAGGRVATFRSWTSLHYRTARLWMVVGVLHVAVELGGWLLSQWYG
jgi:hypothetical protein